MQQTANYNLNLPEGTDVVNPLVDYNPNFSTIDSAMKANADRTVGRATCIKSGTTHVVTRSNPDSNIINFTATGDWNEGDTMTIDSTIVSVFLPDGSAPLTGAYVINTEVMAIINGSRVTLYGAQALPALDASNVNYDNSGSGLTASNVQGAIDEVLAKAFKAVWTNPTPSAGFAGQSISFNGDFSAFIIIWGRSDVLATNGASAIDSSCSLANIYQNVMESNKTAVYQRGMTPTKVGSVNTITFDDCSKAIYNTYGSAPTTSYDNKHCVPFKVLALPV